MSAVDRAIVGAAGATVVGLAGVAGAISYSHMAELARLHGEVGWRAHAFPVSVDGIEVVVSLVLLAHRRAGTRAGWLPWAALAAGTAASVAANVAVGASDAVGGWVAGGGAAGGDQAAGRAARRPVRARRPYQGSAGSGWSRTSVPWSQRARHGAGWDRRGRCRSRNRWTGGDRSPPVPRSSASAGTDPEGLETAARTVRDQLVAAGSPVNRRNLVAGLRSAGHRVRNERLGHLLQIVNAPGPETASPAGVPTVVGDGDHG
jgi:hypothetical protein